MTDLAEMVREAFRIGSAEYIDLIDESTSALASEIEHGENLEVEGRLMNVKPLGKAIVVGDLHGDLESLIHILKKTDFLGKATRNDDVLLIFLGDYGDRGHYSPEIYYILLKMKQIFPQKIILLRGNHEGPEDLLAHPHDLPENFKARFGEEGSAIYSKIRGLFQYLLSSVIVDELCVVIHGGIPSSAKSIQDLSNAHMKHPKESHFEEMLWSDPAENINGTYLSPRGAGRLFGEDITRRFLDLLSVRMLIRGHEPAQLGYKINHRGRILTLFSRKGPPYFNYSAAYLELDLSLKLTDANELIPYVHTF